MALFGKNPNEAAYTGGKKQGRCHQESAPEEEFKMSGKKLTIDSAEAAKGMTPVVGAPDERDIQELSDNELDKVSGGKHYADMSGGALDIGKGPKCEVCGCANSWPIGYNILGLKRSEFVFKCACNSLISTTGKRCGPPDHYF